MQVILAPQVSEKATMVADKYQQVVLRVVGSATKPEVKAAVEMLFKVEVAGVQIANVKGKQKRSGKMHGPPQGLEKGLCIFEAGPGT